jgi:hypothetical protein
MRAPNAARGSARVSLAATHAAGLAVDGLQFFGFFLIGACLSATCFCPGGVTTCAVRRLAAVGAITAFAARVLDAIRRFVLRIRSLVAKIEHGDVNSYLFEWSSMMDAVKALLLKMQGTRGSGCSDYDDFGILLQPWEKPQFQHFELKYCIENVTIKLVLRWLRKSDKNPE